MELVVLPVALREKRRVGPRGSGLRLNPAAIGKPLTGDDCVAAEWGLAIDWERAGHEQRIDRVTREAAMARIRFDRLFARKPIDVLLAQAAEEGDHSLKRCLGRCIPETWVTL
jgi:hypothetical protein